jgi:predicted RNA polymerase sigma factor
MSEDAAAGLASVERISGLDEYLPYHVTRADLLQRLGPGRGSRRCLSARDRAVSQLGTAVVSRGPSPAAQPTVGPVASVPWPCR